MIVGTTPAMLCSENPSLTPDNGKIETGKNLGSSCSTTKPKFIVDFFFLYGIKKYDSCLNHLSQISFNL